MELLNQEEEVIDFTIGKYREREDGEDEYRGSAETVREWEAVRLAIEWVDWAEWGESEICRYEVEVFERGKGQLNNNGRKNLTLRGTRTRLLKDARM